MYPKAFFLPKIKDWSYSVKMAKLLFFSILAYTCIHVMLKLTQDLILCLKKKLKYFQKYCSKMSKTDVFYLKIDDRI